MQTLHTIYNLMPLEAWMSLVGVPLASLTLTKLKKWLTLQSEKVVVTLLFTITTLEGVAVYVVNNVGSTPLWIAPYMGLITTGSLAFYHLLYKPSVKLIADARAQREAEAAARPAVISAGEEPELFVPADTTKAFELPAGDTTVADNTTSPFSA